MIIQRFNLNLIPNQSPVIVHVNQYDTGTGRLIATLYEGNEPYSPNGTAVIQGTKPDGHGFQYSATLNGNVVTADLTEQMSPVAGDVRAQIVVTESSGVTGTFVFIMRVQPSALPSDTDMSESDYPLIEEAIREAQEATERAEAAITETQENAENSEAWAQGTRGGIPVGPTDPTYEHNAEYWAQYAERYAQGGLHYKASIPFANIPTTGMREGDMYDITDDFTTDSRFTEGAGIEVKGGTNIAWNSDNKWDILALPYIPKTTFNGRSGSILPMAGDYDSKKILLSSALHIGGETQNDVQEALKALSNDGVKSFNGRSGSVLPMAGDYDSEKILLASVLHIGGETQENVQKALEALSNDGVKSFNGRSGSVLPMAGDYSAEQVDYDSNQTVKQKIDALVTKEASDIAGQQSLVKDTVGWTGKNLLKNTATSRTTNGITFTVNADKSVTVNGTATAAVFLDIPISLPIGEYVFSGTNNQSGGSPSKYYARLRKSGGIQFATSEISPLPVQSVDGSEIKFKVLQDNLDIRYQICIYPAAGAVSNLTFYPMIRKADITDPTYEPYHESVEEEIEQIYADNGALGAKNLLRNTATSQTINGVTFTVNADGSVTANGTATATINAFWLYQGDFNLEPNKEYILSGCPSGGSSITYLLTISTWKSGGTYANDTGNGVTINGSDYQYKQSPSLRSGIYIVNGTTVNNITFYPMLRLASDPDDTYQPYAMTNRELTEEKINIADLKTVVSASSDFADFKTRIASL